MWAVIVHTYILSWIDWVHVTIEVVKNRSLPSIEIIWLADTAIRESKERIKAVLRWVWVKLPPNKIIVNLAPSGVKKSGAHLDLALALGVYILSTSSKIVFEERLFFWELWLDWSIKPVIGILPLVLSAMKQWWKKFFIPIDNQEEVVSLPWIDCVTCENFHNLIQGDIVQCKSSKKDLLFSTNKEMFSWIQGHTIIKKALCASIIWGHNILLIGSPWSGKTALAQSMKDILPEMSIEESLSTTSIHSLLWLLSPWSWLIRKRPFVDVHNTVTKIKLLWWWRPIKPWLISQAHNWVLFLDELFDFPGWVVDSLRQPMEEWTITISRVEWSIVYPCRFTVIATSNPCPCWQYWDTTKVCSCSRKQVIRYQRKISWPILDRFPMILSVESESTKTVIYWQEKTVDWNAYITTWIKTKNSRTPSKDSWSSFSENATDLLVEAGDIYQYSTRSILNIASVARSIADMYWSDSVSTHHIWEALSLRCSSLLVA